MLDQLLGRASLKERIEELEAERDELEERLEAESERRTEAVRDRQEAQEEVNRLEDRIAQLEGELERRRDDDLSIEFRRTERAGPVRTAELLDRLGSFRTEAEGALTAMVEDDVPLAVRDVLGDRAALVDRAAPCLVCADDAGIVTVALAPPLAPERFQEWGDGFRLEREWFLPTGRHAVALVRADIFAIGEYDGEERLSVESFESEVKGDHSKGGFSQSRFERRREEQIDEHLDACREAIENRDAERLYLVGDGEAIDRLDVDAAATDTVDATGDPGEALESAVRSFWTTRYYGL